jgi:hypothetical protein
MNLDEFKSSWHERHDLLGKERFDAAAADVVARTAKLERAIVRRDLVEAAAAVVVVVFFGVFLWFVPVPTLMIIGVVIIMLSVVEIVAVMCWTRHRDERPNNDAPFLEFSRAELRRMERQIQLLKNVTWWYSGPMMVGCGVMMFGLLHSVPELPPLVFYGFLAAFYACFLAATFIIARINARAVETNLIPVRDELAQLVRALEEE